MRNLLLGLGAQIAIYVVIGLVAVAIVLAFAFFPIKTWFVALVSGAHVSMPRLIGMKMRRIKVKEIVDAYIQAKKAGLSIEIVDLETHYLAGGNVQREIC